MSGKMTRKICCVLFLLLPACCALGQGTRQWRASSYEEFERGTARSVAISSAGFLELAPAFKLLYTSPSTYVWSMVAGPDGAVYAGTGSPARVYRVTPDGKDQVIFEPQELQVQAVALAPEGTVYAATSPDGKVYKITRSAGKAGAEYSSDVFFDPKTKYIWDLALDAQGRLYVATGDRGEIFRVEKNGQGSVFFKSDETHIRVIKFDGQGNLIAGSDGSGLVYRITPTGEGFVLYSPPKKEITALAVDPAGNIYAAATGDKHPVPVLTHGAVAAPVMPTPAIPPPGNAPPANVSLAGSEIYVIAADGSPRKLWSSKEDIVYSLYFESTRDSGQLIAGTGNKGRVLSIQKNGTFTDLLKASVAQVTAFSQAPGGGLYCSGSNLGKIFLMGNALEIEGTFDSSVQDARIFSRWGRAEARGRGNFELFARSGNVDNPDRNWSPWMKIDLGRGSRDEEGQLPVPAARYVQWRAVLRPATPSTKIDEVTINYLPRNVAPVIDDVYVQTGARFQPPVRVAQPEQVPVGPPPTTPLAVPRVEAPPAAIRDRDYLAVRWTAHDDNDDDLVFALYYRGDNEREWKLLKSGLTDKFYSFESGLLPDGGYTLKVKASDAPSHTPEDDLSDEKESARFEIDNTPPRIQKLAARVEGGKLHASFQATDDFSPIKKAEYSIDAGEWQYLEPAGGISDSRTESYDFLAKPAAPASAEHVVVVRVYDRYDNVATAKTVVH